MKIAITGATGFIGLHLINTLVDEHEVIPFVRKETVVPTSFHKMNIQPRLVNLHDIKNLQSNLEDIDILIHCAGVIKGISKHDYDMGNVLPTQNIVSAIENLPKQPYLIYISSAAACGPSLNLNHLKNEESIDTPVSVYGKSKKQAEEVIARSNKLNSYSIIRPVGVYGPGDMAFLPIFQLAKKKLAFYLGSPQTYIDIIHVKDLVGAILSVAKLKPHKEKYIISDGKHYTQKDIVHLAINVMGYTKPKFSFTSPNFLTLFIGKLSTSISKITRKPYFFNKDKAIEAIQKNWAFDTTKIRKIYKPSIESQEGFIETRNYYQDKNLI